jgi:hypothetical protein
MSIEIKEVKSKGDLTKFIKYPFKLYKGNNYWVPPLIFDDVKTLSKDKNPAFEFCDARYWLAYKDGKIVGRIAGIINNKFNELWNQKAIRFGWIDFDDDPKIAKLLMAEVEKWGKEKGLEYIHGPLGFTDFDPEGLLIEGFEELSTFGAIYNYPYYQKHIEGLKFEKDADWIEFSVKAPTEPNEKVARIAGVVAQRNKLSTLKVTKAKDLLPYAKEIFVVINEAYKHLYGFVPLTEKQMDLYVKAYFGFIKPGYVPVILDENGRVAAFGITMPSLSKAMQKANGRLFPFGFIHILNAMRKCKDADLYLTAVRKDLQEKGVNALLINEVSKVFINNKINLVETNRELEENYKIQAQWRFYDARQHKRRRCYKKNLA